MTPLTLITVCAIMMVPYWGREPAPELPDFTSTIEISCQIGFWGNLVWSTDFRNITYQYAQKDSVIQVSPEIVNCTSSKTKHRNKITVTQQPPNQTVSEACSRMTIEAILANAAMRKYKETIALNFALLFSSRL